MAGLPPALTFGVSLPQIGYGSSVTLSGQVNNKKAGEQVTIASTPYGQLSPVVLANIVTGTDGTFAFTTKPQLLTSYLATWKGVNSLAATVAVAPVITFGRNNGWVSKIYAGRSMVPRRSRCRWSRSSASGSRSSAFASARAASPGSRCR